MLCQDAIPCFEENTQTMLSSKLLQSRSSFSFPNSRLGTPRPQVRVVPKREFWNEVLKFALALLVSQGFFFPNFTFAAEGEKAQEKPRQVFVLHSGLHTIFSDRDPNRVSESIHGYLRKQGVAEQDIVVLDNPFPVANWKQMFPKETVPLDFMLPSSQVSQQAYLRLHQALVEKKVKPNDNLIWIGHSAGGQIGLTMAHLGSHLAGYPDLARAASAYRFDMVVTLGAPLATNLLPKDVKLRHYFSPQDRVVHWACLYGTFALNCLGHSVQLSEVPPLFPANAIIRIFRGVEHPCWDDERVVHRILAELRQDYLPLWQTSALSPAMGPALSQVLCQAMENQCFLSVEDPLEE
jgi:hypothetical protein